MTVRYLSSSLWPLTSDGTDVTMNSGQILGTAGAVVATATQFSHAGDTDSGFGFLAADVLGLAAGGVWYMRVESGATSFRTGNIVRFASAGSLDTPTVGITDNATGVLEVNNGAGGTFRDLIVRTLRSSGSNGQETQIQTASALLSALSGATVVSTDLIPANALVFGVTARVTTLITGATSFDIGDEATPDKWGKDVDVAATTTTTLANATIVTPTIYTVAQDVILTARGGDFTAGAVRVTVHYLTLVAPTS